MLLSEVPEIHGRSAAGVSQIATGHASPATIIAAAPASSWRMRRPIPYAVGGPTVRSGAAIAADAVGAADAASEAFGRNHSHAAAIPGATINATPIFVSKPRPTSAPEITSQRDRPSSNARTSAHTAPTQRRTRSASGLLWREIATV